MSLFVLCVGFDGLFIMSCLIDATWFYCVRPCCCLAMPRFALPRLEDLAFSYFNLHFLFC